MASKTGKSLDLEGNCVLCCQELEIYAIGKCDHPVCYRCSTKMRVLCEQKYCAVCREELDKVIFVKKVVPFLSINTQQMQYEKNHDIYFSDGKMFSQYRKLLQHECTLCPEVRPFHAFPDLEQHMRKHHELFSCKLCLKHLKNFTYERKWYNRKDLARHRIHGDPEDTSHRGHPLCKFCDERYLDNDELLKHLRRDHYFCHFCDSDGAQEYYSEYNFLREHFRDSHFLCEEGRCSTEQFTHAFRTEIDYKAHKTSCHSKSRAEARQNRQIDLQFNYAPRHNRRNEGIVGGEDYEEVDRFNRSGRLMRGGGARGGQQNRRGSWRYKREEEDREVAAAVRASVAARRQEEMGRKQPSENPENAKSRKEETREPEEGRKTKVFAKPAPEVTGPDSLMKTTTLGAKETRSNGPLNEEDFPAFGSAPAAPSLSAAKPAQVKLKEEDFPSLSAVSSPASSSSSSVPAFSAGITYTARNTNRFQEEDFPALVSNIKPNRPMSSVTSAWAASTSKSKPKPATPSMASSKVGKGAPLLGNSKGTTKKSPKPSSFSEEEEDGNGITQQEFRNTPTMFDISKLLTAPAPQSSGKVNKKKRVGSEKQGSSSSSQPSVDRPANSSLKENARERERNPTPPASSILGDKSNTVANGPTEKVPEKSSVSSEPPGFKMPVNSAPQYPLPEEDFPALVNNNVLRMPPPGFSPVVTVAPLAPPPGLSTSVGKPPPGFSNIHAVSHPAEPPIKPVKEQTFCSRPYLVPENFQQRNIHLINSIKDFLHSDESKFNEFKSHSGKFRQGLITASEYYKSCRQLLGENFNVIFNELLVLLPDTSKQQELLSAHRDYRQEDKPISNKSKKNKKGAWKTDSNASDQDYSTCPSCGQVLAPRDVTYHKTLHIEDNDFPSLQAISRIIS
ncbi:E3 ubiquitin-protein ligase ZNF598 [Spea bombifrons]|uniref:E3 ubiquitin-protein ligase ZNF598 n=1 Tax=Spea bombifrons TaxID=233779 RepID=UPI00234B81F8|nr:E3 ubiquitin-protein ligase ZNF598 [Spea bombifrons]